MGCIRAASGSLRFQISEGRIKNKCSRNNSNLKPGKDTLLIYLCLFRLLCFKKRKKVAKVDSVLFFSHLSSQLPPVCPAETLSLLYTYTPHQLVTYFVLTHSGRVKLQSSEGAPRGPLQSILWFLYRFCPLERRMHAMLFCSFGAERI